ncbi:MAG: nucleoside triphosphate pyrophosphatase [Phycisphaerales bacterium]
MIPEPPTLLLASQSPRRRELLAAADIAFKLAPPEWLVDDTDLHAGSVQPRHWAAALAYLKAAGTARKIERAADPSGTPRHPWVILGADTVVVRDHELFGKARDADDARRIIRALSAGEHEVITGVCLLDACSGARRLFSDTTIVHVGTIPDAEVDAYVASGRWAGKAGAYNLEDRRAAGWPITCIGDPTTVVGLPMVRLLPLLARHRARAS